MEAGDSLAVGLASHRSLSLSLFLSRRCTSSGRQYFFCKHLVSLCMRRSSGFQTLECRPVAHQPAATTRRHSLTNAVTFAASLVCSFSLFLRQRLRILARLRVQCRRLAHLCAWGVGVAEGRATATEATGAWPVAQQTDVERTTLVNGLPLAGRSTCGYLKKLKTTTTTCCRSFG